MSSTSVRISSRIHDVLQTLSKEEDLPMQTIVERAVESYRRQRFLLLLNDDFARLRQSKQEWQAYQTELSGWDVTVADGRAEFRAAGGTTEEEGFKVKPLRGQVWKADLDPVRGHEQAGYRPFLILSADVFNQGSQELVIGCPITRTLRPIRSHLQIAPPEGGVKEKSAILCEQIRVISQDRLATLMGSVSEQTLIRVEAIVRLILDFS